MSVTEPSTLYAATVPAYRALFRSLSNIFTKAKAHVKEDPAESSRLARAALRPGMFDLRQQVEVNMHYLRCTLGALGIELPLEADGVVVEADGGAASDSLASIETIAARVEVALAAVDQISQAAFDGAAGATVGVLAYSVGGRHGPAQTIPFRSFGGYVREFLLPNTFFHVNMAYAILRLEGVDVGKGDYLTPFLVDSADIFEGK